MAILTTIFFILIGIIALLLILALFMKKEHYVQRSIVIRAPRQKVFDYIKLLRNQEHFNKWAKTDPNRIWEYTGTDGTVGFVIAWKGNKQAGEGAKEIMAIEEGKKIASQIRFIKPMAMVADIVMETESISDTETKVSMSNSGTINYPLNLMIPFAEKNFPKDMDASLIILKEILEK